jgi:hypothetical protein
VAPDSRLFDEIPSRLKSFPQFADSNENGILSETLVDPHIPNNLACRPTRAKATTA